MRTELIVSPDVDGVVAEIVERFQPERIVLFGSHAAGRADAGSDVDVLVVMETELRPLQQAAAISRAISHRVPVDLVVRTPRQLAAPDPRDLLLRRILRDGAVVYASGG